MATRGPSEHPQCRSVWKVHLVRRGNAPFGPWAPEVFGEQLSCERQSLSDRRGTWSAGLPLRTASPWRRSVSTLTPGPIVDETTTFFRYLPLDEDGLARSSSSSTAESSAADRPPEADFADGHVHVAVAVGAVLDLAAFELGDGLRDVVGDGAGLGVGHQTAGAERATELADHRHEIGRGDGDVEVEEAAFDARDEIFGADDLGTGIASGRGAFTLREHRDSHVLARAGGQARRCRAPSGRPCVDRRRAEATTSTDSSNLRLLRLLTNDERLGGRVLSFPVEAGQLLRGLLFPCAMEMAPSLLSGAA